MFSLANKLRPEGAQPRAGRPTTTTDKAKGRSGVEAEEDTRLAERLIAEAKWGLAWLLKTRFGDGYRVSWATMDYWTDGVKGTADDTFGDVRNAPFDNYLAAAAEALAYRALKASEPALAAEALKAAQADWQFALTNTASPNLELAAAAALASLELFKCTNQSRYADKAIEFAEIILQCQQVEYTDWQTPLAGFFYTNPRRERLLHYSHRGHEQAPVAALSELCAWLPNHPNWMRWYNAVALHSEYLRTISQYTEPYAMLPSGVYNLEESQAAWYQAQILRGIPLNVLHYLRRFPIWTSFRGNHGTVLSQTKALSAAAHLRQDLALADMAQEQLEWVVGRNPMAQSTMYGEGYDFAPQYTAMSGDIAGSLPVGIQTRANEDKPYWPAANCYNYKEVWVHPSSRWLALMQDLNGAARVKGLAPPGIKKSVVFRETSTGRVTTARPESRSGRFTIELPEGHYWVSQGRNEQTPTLLPGEVRELDLRQGLIFDLAQTTSRDGQVTIEVKASGTGMHWFTLRTHNLTLLDQPRPLLTLAPDKAETMRWTAKMNNLNQMWVALVVPDNDLAQRREALGRRTRQ